MKNLVILAGVLMLVGVSSQATEREHGGLRAPKGINILFGSIGSGIDGKTQDAVLEIVKTETKNGKLELMTVKPWGREGERDLCLQFTDISYVQEIFTELKDVVAAGNAASAAERTDATLVLNCTGEEPQPNE